MQSSSPTIAFGGGGAVPESGVIAMTDSCGQKPCLPAGRNLLAQAVLCQVSSRAVYFEHMGKIIV